MKENIKNLLLFIATTVVGFFAMAVPFKLFTELTQTQMRILLIAEIAVSVAIFCAVFLRKEAKEQRKRKAQEAFEKHCKRVETRNESLKGIRVYNYDIAA